MFTVYGRHDSGNCYKVKLILAELQLPYRWIEVARGQTRSAEFLARNPAGQVPVLALEGGGFLPESNAILNYLAEDTRLLPGDRLDRARVLQWMFFEQSSHEPSLGVARSILRDEPADSPRRAELPRLQERGRHALGVMEQHLRRERFFAIGAYTIADMALYPCTHLAEDAGLTLAPFPAVRDWLERVRSQPQHLPMYR